MDGRIHHHWKDTKMNDAHSYGVAGGCIILVPIALVAMAIATTVLAVVKWRH